MKKTVFGIVVLCFAINAIAQEPVKKAPSGKAIEALKRKKEKAGTWGQKPAGKVSVEKKPVLVPKERCGTR
ncbi:MAG TPA: hypothetical protein VD905_11015 [Flavobacteriales bacterium]|nr:hypothetical protein [Flavobacteriales bacterium]